MVDEWPAEDSFLRFFESGPDIGAMMSEAGVTERPTPVFWRVASELGGAWVHVDVADNASVQRSIAEAGELDLLVANAGISEGLESGPSWTLDPQEWWHVYEVNVLGVHLCCGATADALPDDAPWTPPELAPKLVRRLASGRYDALAGRYLHAEHDDLDALLDRLDEIRDRDLNAIRLRR